MGPDGDYHVGRGGAGNERVETKQAHKKTIDTAPSSEAKPQVGLADKIKNKLFGGSKK